MPYKVRGPRSTFKGGSVTVGSSTSVQQDSFFFGKDYVESVSSPGPPYNMHNAFRSVASDGSPGTMNGKHGSYSFSNYRVTPGLNSTNLIIGFVTIRDDPSTWQRWVNKALAEVNFTKPVISLPNVLWELREFPGMLRDLGRVLEGGSRASDIPGAHLAWQFGWSPLFQDVQTLMNLGAEIEKAQQLFLKAQSRKKLGGHAETLKHSLVDVFLNAVPGASLRREWDVNLEAWWTAHWDILEGYPPLLFGHIAGQYANALGLAAPQAAIWNAIPWSFIVDYFFEVSTLIEATSGLAQYRPATICVMAKVENQIRKEELSSSLSPVGRYTPATYKVTSKARRVYPDPRARPIFQPWGFIPRLGILSSLVTASALRSVRR